MLGRNQNVFYLKDVTKAALFSYKKQLMLVGRLLPHVLCYLESIFSAELV